MTLGGWIVMVVSVGSVTGLFAWCIWRVLRDPGQARHLHGFEAEPPDKEG
jgi:hypothetical protein